MQNFLSKIGSVFYFFMMNTAIISICIVIYIIYTCIIEKVRNTVCKLLLRIFTLIIVALLVFWWYNCFGFFAVITPCILGLVIAIAFFMNLAD